MENGLSTGDLALMRDNDGFGSNGGFMWGFRSADPDVRYG